MMQTRLTRRGALGLALGAAATLRAGAISAQTATPDWTVAPIGWPDRLPGDGFQIGHGFACENTWFAEGWWHTGEDWYAVNGDSAGATIYTVADGEVVYADFNYPGRVVIIQHAHELFSMYGHLDPELAVQAGQPVTAGDRLGVLLRLAPVRGPGQAPSHLHFEMRTFLTRDDVNGSTPQHGVNCGFQCPPGPGYWPIGASRRPAELGWLNPTHGKLTMLGDNLPGTLDLIANSAFDDGTIPMFSDPDEGSTMIGEIGVTVESRALLLDLHSGDPASAGTSAEAYDAWFRIETADEIRGWIRAAVASDRETGSDGRPSALDVPFLITAIDR